MGCYSLNHSASGTPTSGAPNGPASATAGGPACPAGSVNPAGRASMQSMESGLCRQSYVSSSSSSSLGSLDHLEAGGACCSGGSGCGGSGAGMDADSAYSSTGTASARSLSLLPGSAALSPCSLRSWLQEAGLGQCAEALLAAGYDLGTATRMTPEDMNAAGLTNPQVRKRLKAELSRACISDGLPEFIPESVVHWMKCLNLDEYCDMLLRQGYTSVEKVMDITWEDLEDIGIKRLGHQKKIILAIERLRRLKKGCESAQAAAAAAAAAAAVTGCPPRPSRFHHHHHHHHHHQPTLHTPPPSASSPAAQPGATPPPSVHSAPSAGVQTSQQPPTSTAAPQSPSTPGVGSLTPKRTPRHAGDELRLSGDLRTFQQQQQQQQQAAAESPQPPPSPRTAVVPPTVAPKPTPPRLPLPPAHGIAPGPSPASASCGGKPVAKIPPGRVMGGSPLSPGGPGGAGGSLERKRQPPPPPPKRITSMMKSGSASPQAGGSPVRRQGASPAASRRHNYENLGVSPGKVEAGVASALAVVVSQAERRRASLEQQLHIQQQQAAQAKQHAAQAAQQAAQKQQALEDRPPSVKAATLGRAMFEATGANTSAAVVAPFGTATMRRSSAPCDRRGHHQGTPPHQAGLRGARRSPEMTDDSCLGQGEMAECLKSRSSSTLSVESNSLPFANENVGTIKQRSNNNAKPSLSSLDFYASLDLNVGSYTAENGTIRRKASPPMTVAEHSSPLLDSPRKLPPPVPRRRDSIGTGEAEDNESASGVAAHDQEQLDDICDMLEDLSDMLEREIAEDEQLRLT